MTLIKTLMLSIAILVGVLILAALGSVPASVYESIGHLPKITETKPLLLNNVHLLSKDGRQWQMNQQLVIRNGRIEHIGVADVVRPSGYQVVDAKGAYVIPGLFDMHVHALDPQYLALSLSYGVTSVRNMGGYPVHLRWKKQLQEGQWLGSNLFVSSPILNGDVYFDPFTQQRVTDPDHARELVARYQAQGWDLIKVYEGLGADVYAAIVDEALARGMLIAGHVPYDAIKQNYEAAAALTSIEHVEELFDGPLNDRFDYQKLTSIAQQLKIMGVAVTPTLTVFDHLTQLSTHKQSFKRDIPFEYMNPFHRWVMDQFDGNRWMVASQKQAQYNQKVNRFQRDIVAELSRHDVELLVGTDWGAIYTIPGLATHQELMLLSESGLSSDMILRAATMNAARALNVDADYGSIEVGKIADLVVVMEDPLKDLSRLRAPQAVIKMGQYLDREDLLVIREQAKNHSSAYTTFGRVMEFVVSKGFYQ